ncbi:hypothetical protein VTK56DRAFT_7302 [Thermocarpiscus australiensis]
MFRAGAEFQQLKELICPQTRPHVRVGTTMRPDLSGDRVKPHTRTHEVLSRVASKMQDTIRSAGEQSADVLLESRRRFPPPFRPRYRAAFPPRLESVFEGIGDILYDQGWTDDLAREIHETRAKYRYRTDYETINLAFPYVFEMMLLVDYGFPASPLRTP